MRGGSQQEVSAPPSLSHSPPPFHPVTLFPLSQVRQPHELGALGCGRDDPRGEESVPQAHGVRRREDPRRRAVHFRFQGREQLAARTRCPPASNQSASNIQLYICMKFSRCK